MIGGMAVISVGATMESRMKEKKDRVAVKEILMGMIAEKIRTRWSAQVPFEACVEVYGL